MVELFLRRIRKRKTLRVLAPESDERKVMYHNFWFLLQVRGGVSQGGTLLDRAIIDSM